MYLERSWRRCRSQRWYQIAYTDWEDQTFSRNLISGCLGQIESSTWPSLSCYLTSALGSPSSSAPLQVHLGRGDLPPNAVALHCSIIILVCMLKPLPSWLFLLISWIREWSLSSVHGVILQLVPCQNEASNAVFIALQVSGFNETAVVNNFPSMWTLTLTFSFRRNTTITSSTAQS